MTLSFQYTADDYHEAVTGAPKRHGTPAPAGALAAGFLLLALAFMLFVLLRYGSAGEALPAKSLWMRILYAAGPSALLSAFFAFAVLRPMLKGPRKPWEQSQQRGGVKPPRTPKPGLVVVAALGVIVATVLLWMQQRTPELSRAPGSLPRIASTWSISDPDLLIPLIPWAFLVAIMLLAAAVQQLRGFYKLWEAQSPLRRPHQVEFYDYGVIVSNAYVRTTSQWQAFEGFRETPNLFVLYTSPLAFLIVPKRAFPDAAQIDAFRGLALNRVGKGSFLPQHGGFPVLPVEAQPA